MRLLTELIVLGLAFVTLACSANATATADDHAKNQVKPVIPIRAHAFALRDVALLDGPFQHAQELDRAYLLSLDVDQLLHTFRLNAGLPSNAKPLGGWEEPKCELRGHFVGHYMTACALMYASTGDERLKAKGDAVVKGLAECQAKLGTGYLSAYPEEFLDRVEKRQRVWAPYYTLHKIYAGLQDMYVHCDNQQALDVCRRFADWVIARNSKLTDEQMQRMLGEEHGGMNETLANLYALTGDTRYLAISKRFNHLAVIGPAMARQDKLTGLHANTQIPKFVGTALQYQLTGEEPLKTASIFFWDTVVHERSYVIGGHSDGEMFSPKERLSTALGPNTTETCNTYNMLKLTRHLFAWEPKAAYADYYERALYNHILSSQNPEDGMMCYYVPLRSGSHKVYNGRLDAFWCCTGTGIENHAKYRDSIYFHDGDKTLYVNLFIASELNWKAKGITIRQETRYPEQQATKLVFTCDKATELAVKVRRPSWATTGFDIKLNGQVHGVNGQPGSYVTLSRTWKTGDTVEVVMPFTLRTEGFKDNPNRFAFLHGPLVLSAQADPRKPFPAIVAENGKLLQSLKPVAGKASTFAGPADVFRIPGVNDGQTVLLEPFYKMHGGRRYMVYFDAFTPDQWQAKEKAYQADMAREKALEAKTVDVAKPGFEQNERDHNLKGERTSSGDFGERKYRHATDGGWFSWDLKVHVDKPLELWVTYWGSDVGRTFDVLIDGQKVATQNLQNNKPNQFFDQVYPIPAELVKGKAKITVKFAAAGNGYAGGVFGVRVMEK